MIYRPHGAKDGQHNRWCMKYSRACAAAVNHCRNVGGKEPTDG